MPQYRDPFITKLIGIFNAEGPASLKNRYYYGDPMVVAKSQLPAVFISKDKTTIAPETNEEDVSTIPMIINVVMDLTRDFGQAFNSINSMNQVYEAIEARNVDYTLRSDSLAYLLRKHMELDSQVWIDLSSGLELDYGVGMGKRGEGIFTVEGVMKFTVTHIQMRPGQS